MARSPDMSPGWNIPQGDSLQESPNSGEQKFSLRSFSNAGGGDAPMITNLPRMRSQLFTISTRSLMASQSPLKLNYSTPSLNEDIKKDVVPPTLTSPRNYDHAANVDTKPINTASNVHCGSTGGAKKKSVTDLSPPTIPVKRCIHGSMEDLRGFETSNKGSAIRKATMRKSAPLSSNRGQIIEAANELLVEENKHLIKTIQQIRRKLLLAKITSYFTLEGLKRRGKAIKKIEALKLEKDQQCAARLILHSLLVNCWRNTKRELDMRLEDNTELKKSVENFTLQVQVLRHVQTSEKQKSQEKSNLIQSLNDELRILKEENHLMRKEIEKMENELNSLQASAQNLSDENKILTGQITNMLDKRDKMVQSLDRERLRSDQLLKENTAIREKMTTVEAQLFENIEQKSHWQERARCSESEVWELQLHLQTRDNNIKELAAACDVLRTEKRQLIDLKSELKMNLDQTTISLQNLGQKNDELMETYEAVRNERDTKSWKLLELEKTLEETKKEFQEVERELLSYKLQNVRRRREWGNALYFIVNPVEAVRRNFT